ncbi:MAG: RNA pseudouridine synthase [Bacteroidetes bacterium]|jgi:23S rRNA pseudouridine1911/1915/1917 synthase|nr:RNA pseudouridine synthase [Bacteroidota bacterium]
MQRDLDILYEDNHLIAINKTNNDIVQGDKTGDKPLSEIVKAYLKVKYSKPGNVYLGVAHRLDRPVSGIVLFARTSKALPRLNEMFRNGAISKKYLAIVKNPPPDIRGELVHYITRNTKQNKSYAHAREVNGSKKAVLNYEQLASSDHYHLLSIDLQTGRHHQIRAQMAAIGCPIKGDLKYGFDRSNKDGGICLHAHRLNFSHPVKKEPVIILANTPENEKLWKILMAKTS